MIPSPHDPLGWHRLFRLHGRVCQGLRSNPRIIAMKIIADVSLIHSFLNLIVFRHTAFSQSMEMDMRFPMCSWLQERLGLLFFGALCTLCTLCIPPILTDLALHRFRFLQRILQGNDVLQPHNPMWKGVRLWNVLRYRWRCELRADFDSLNDIRTVARVYFGDRRNALWQGILASFLPAQRGDLHQDQWPDHSKRPSHRAWRRCKL